MRRGEQKLQTAIVVALRRRFDVLIWHCPNGGARTKLEALAFRDAGVTAGAPDLVVAGPRGGILHLELKDKVQARERSVSPFERIHSLDPNQKLFVARLRDLGHDVAVVDSVEDAELACISMGFPSPRPTGARSAPELATGF